MADDTAPLDLFKFLALRPAQRPPDRRIAVGFIRDTRISNEEGRRAIAIALREQLAGGPPSLDPVRLKALAGLRRAALDGLVAQQPNDVGSYLKQLVDDRDIGTDATWEAVWHGVYLAYRVGPAAGRHLDEPVAALRFLHAWRLARAGLISDLADLRSALLATPLVPDRSQLLPDLPAAPTSEPAAPAGTQGGADAPTRSHSLLAELAATERLLAAVSAPPVTATPVEMQVRTQTESSGTVLRTEALIRRVPKLSAAAIAPSEAESSVMRRLALGDASTVPVASRALQGHLQSLTREAMSMRRDAQFVEAVRTADVRSLKVVLPGLQLPDAPYVHPGAFGKVSAADVDVRRRIRPLGIGDLKVVKQTLLRYVPGEVAHIENVLKGEHKSRKHRVLDRSETMFVTREEEAVETERDTQTTDRFELKREAEKTIKQDMDVSAGVTVTGSYGPVEVTAQGDFTYSTSVEESQKSSANFAREVVDRSVSRIQKKTASERTTKALHEVEEINDHGLDNVGGVGHVTGVYRWVDKRYRAQVYNYGARLMIEFVVPDPAAYFRHSLAQADAAALDIKAPVPFLDLDGNDLTPADIDPSNYQIFVARYNAAGVAPPPAEYLYVGAAFEQNEIENGRTFSKSLKDIAIPEGYVWDHYEVTAAAIYENFPQFCIQVAGRQHVVLSNNRARRMNASSYGVTWGGDWEDDPRGIVPVSAIGYDVNAYSVHVSVTCRRTLDLYQKWQLQTYDKIATAYQALQTAYDQKLSQIKANRGPIVIEGRNPALNREIERRELKRLCVTLLTGRHFNEPGCVAYPSKPNQLPEVDVLRTLAQGPTIQFFEQAFDWTQLTYLFYPYFWARKDRWPDMSHLNDPDPLFGQFLQAGAARVVVPVPIAYKDAVLYFLETGLVWEGGESPRLDDPLFVSIADELRNRTDDLAGAVPEGEPWEFTLPTTLVWLQPGPELPVLSA